MKSTGERKISAQLFGKSFNELCAQYNIQALPENFLNEIIEKTVRRNAKNAAEEDGAEEEMGEEEDAEMEDSYSSSTSTTETDESEYQLVKTKRRLLNQQNRKANEEKKNKQDTAKKPTEPEDDNYYKLLQRKEQEKRTPVPPQISAEKIIRPPPIICYNLNLAHFDEKLDKLPTRPRFFVKNANKARTTIKPATDEDHQILFKVIQEIKVDCYSFTSKSERMISLVLKGVQCSFTPEQVEIALEKELPNVKIARVTRLITPRTKKMGNINAYVVNFEQGSNVDDIMKVNRLLYQVVYWERYRSPAISQCKNCQKYGHVASNCGTAYRCVKCNVKHGPQACPRDPNVGLPYCANCQKEGHRANYRDY